MNKVAHYNGFVGRCQQYGLTNQAADTLYKKKGLTKSAQSSITGLYMYPGFSQDMQQAVREHPTATAALGGAALAIPAALTAPLWAPAVGSAVAAAGPALASGAAGASALATRCGPAALNAAKRYGPAAYNATVNAAKRYGPDVLHYGGKALRSIPRFGWKALNYGSSNIFSALANFGSKTLRGIANFTPHNLLAPIYSKVNGVPVGVLPGLSSAASRIGSAYNFYNNPVHATLSSISASSQLATMYNYRDQIRKWLVTTPKKVYPYVKDTGSYVTYTVLAANEYEKGKIEARRNKTNNETIDKARDYNQNANNVLKKYVNGANDYAKGAATNLAEYVTGSTRDALLGIGGSVIGAGNELQTAATDPIYQSNRLIDKTTDSAIKKIDDLSNKISKKLDTVDTATQTIRTAQSGAGPVTTAATALGAGKEPIRATDALHIDKIPYFGALMSRPLGHMSLPWIWAVGRPYADWQNYSNRMPKDKQSISGRMKYILNGVYDELYRKGLPPTQEQL